MKLSKFNAIIIDDEYLARNITKTLIEKYIENVNIIAETDDLEEAARIIRENEIKIIFLDVKMPAMNGFEFIKLLKNNICHIVIISAYEEYAFTAYQYNDVHYILKPVSVDDLRVAIDKIMRLESDADTGNEALNNSETLFIKSKRSVLALKIDDIIAIEASGNYSIFHMKDEKQKVSSKSISNYQNLLGSKFIRIHHSYVINIANIKTINMANNTAIMLNDVSFPISFRKIKSVLQFVKSFS